SGAGGAAANSMRVAALPTAFEPAKLEEGEESLVLRRHGPDLEPGWKLGRPRAVRDGAGARGGKADGPCSRLRCPADPHEPTSPARRCARPGHRGLQGWRKRNILKNLCRFFSSRRRHTRLVSDWSSDVCSSDLSDRSLVLPTIEEVHRWQTITQF